MPTHSAEIVTVNPEAEKAAERPNAQVEQDDALVEANLSVQTDEVVLDDLEFSDAAEVCVEPPGKPAPETSESIPAPAASPKPSPAPIAVRQTVQPPRSTSVPEQQRKPPVPARDSVGNSAVRQELKEAAQPKAAKESVTPPPTSKAVERPSPAKSPEKPVAPKTANQGDGGGGNERPPKHEGSDDPERPNVDKSKAMGFPIERLEVKNEEGEYSEREQILEDVNVKIDARRATYVELAKSMGFDPTEGEIRNWKPNDAEVQELKKQLRPERVRAKMCEGLTKYVNDPERMRELLPQQQDALVKTQGFMETATRDKDGGKSGDVDMPTGTGKTGEFISVIKAVKLEEDPDDPIKVVILAPTKQILLQTIGDLSAKKEDRTGFAKFAPRLEVGGYYEDKHNLESPITVMTNAAFNKLVQEGKMPWRDVVIIDEAHTDLGENISKSVQKYKPGKVTLAYTATREYHPEKSVGNIVTHPIFELKLTTAIKAGRLAPVKALNREITLTFNEDELPEDSAERWLQVETAYIDAFLDDAMPDILKAVREGRGVLVRCPAGPGENVIFARYAQDRIQQELVTTLDRTYQGKVRAAAIGGKKQSTRDQQMLLEAYKRGRVHVLTYVDLINMGTDLPNAKLLVDLRRMGKSKVSKAQALGRILRPQFDDKGRPIPALAIDYTSDVKNHTFRDVLHLRPGEVTVQATHRYEPQEKPAPVVLKAAPATVWEGGTGVTTLEHEDKLSYRFDSSEILTFDSACEAFNINPKIMTNYLDAVGYEGRPNLAAYQYATLAEMIAEGWLKDD
jgi:superfamily II DNA or RNA helicase